MEVTHVFYEGINEKGLMGAGFVSFPNVPRPNSQELNPGYVVTHALLQCATVDDVVNLLTKEITCIYQSIAGTLPTVHWTFSGRSGETIIIEPDDQQMTIYRILQA